MTSLKEIEDYYNRSEKSLLQNSISVVNHLDDTLPSKFTYLYKNTYDISVEDCDIFDTFECSCKSCSSNSNCCYQTGGFWRHMPYKDSFRHTVLRNPLKSPPCIFECGARCLCAKSCLNRETQNGIKHRLEVFKDASLGWSLRTLGFIFKGEFVVEYTGMIVSKDVADKMPAKNKTYQFAIDPMNCETEKYVIDGEKQGNISRFINSRCVDANLIAKHVYSTTKSELSRICFFAVRDIQPKEPLNYDYFSMLHILGITCLCNSSFCQENVQPIMIDDGPRLSCSLRVLMEDWNDVKKRLSKPEEVVAFMRDLDQSINNGKIDEEMNNKVEETSKILSRKELTEELIYICSSSETLISDLAQEEKVPVTSSIDIIEIDSSSSSSEESCQYRSHCDEARQEKTNMTSSFVIRSSSGSSSVEVVSSSFACSRELASTPVGLVEVAPVPSDIILDDSEFERFIKTRDSEMDRHLAWLRSTSEYSQQFEEFRNTVENMVEQANTNQYL